MLPTKFHVFWPYVSGEVKNSFQDGGHGSHHGFQVGRILAIFCSTRHPDASYQVSIGLLVQEMAAMMAILDFGSERS